MQERGAPPSTLSRKHRNLICRRFEDLHSIQAACGKEKSIFLLFSYNSNCILSGISSDILSYILSANLLTFFLTYLSTFFLTNTCVESPPKVSCEASADEHEKEMLLKQKFFPLFQVVRDFLPTLHSCAMNAIVMSYSPPQPHGLLSKTVLVVQQRNLSAPP